ERREEVLAFAPLTSAPWGVAVRQSREEAFAYSDALQQRVLLFGISAFILAILSAWLLTRSVVKPIRTLTVACQRIAEGDLSLSLPPIPSIGGDELLTLAHSFEIMRARLEKSLEEIQRWTEQLEQRVQQRTKELEESQRQLVSVNQMLQSKEQARSELLRKIIVAQEEERRRIARELHDEMSQVLTALSVALEAAIMAPASKADDVKARLVATKSLVSGMLGEVQRMILDLRPSLLDDLGLIPAIDWYAESRLKASGIRVELETAGVEKRLPSELETVIFRLTQEAITNIAKHARAENVSISLEFKESAVVIDIEDDGCGFAVDQVLGQRKRNQAFGLLGMKERVDLFGGTLSIHSKPGEGTRLVVEIPISGMEPSNGENKGIAGRRSRHTEGRTTGSSRPL
ncbi:MAG: sensor histidine kinase, partial [Chloroflexi bacterium]|nr:sensor histidine kinase [Chloroflexota bacterium]